MLLLLFNFCLSSFDYLCFCSGLYFFLFSYFALQKVSISTLFLLLVYNEKTALYIIL